MKRVVLIVIAFLMLIVPGVLSSGQSSAGISEYHDGSVYSYETYGTDGSYRSTITSYEGDVIDIRIPSALEGHPVTVIGNNAFSNEVSRSIIIPERIVEIGDNAFSGCTSLKKAYFLGDMPQIGVNAFPADCVIYHSDTNGTWDDLTGNKGTFKTTSIDGLSYYLINGTATVHKHVDGIEVTVPDTVTIDENEYEVTSIGPWAFYDSGITSVTFGKNIRDIGERAFYKCRELTTASLSDNISIIDDEAFRECPDLTDIEIHSNIRYIGFEAFRMCNSFTEVTVPASVSFLGQGAFRACYGLEYATVHANVTELSAFDNCHQLKGIVLPETLVTIGDNAFINCSSLEVVSLPDEVRHIGTSAFSGCRSLYSVDMNKGLEKIGDKAFFGCTSLTKVTIPKSVIDIGRETFFLSSLKEASFMGDRPAIGEDAFTETSDAFRITYTEAYADSWKGYDEYRTIMLENDDMLLFIAIAIITVLAVIVFIIVIRKGNGGLGRI